jgi:type II secretory pathway component PulC
VVDDTHCEVARTQLWGEQTGCLTDRSSNRTVRKDGQVGVELSRVRPKSLLARCGFKSGDVLLAVNHQSLSSPESALASYASLKAARALSFELLRGRRRLTLTISVNP